MNDCKFMGRLTADPELQYTNDGKSVCKFSMAVNRDYKNAEGKYDADFFNYTAWNKTGEVIAKYVKKGHRLIVHGNLRNRKYQANDGTNRTVTFINVNSIEFIEKFNSNKQQEQKPLESGDYNGDYQDIDFEDVPF